MGDHFIWRGTNTMIIPMMNQSEMNHKAMECINIMNKRILRKKREWRHHNQRPHQGMLKNIIQKVKFLETRKPMYKLEENSGKFNSRVDEGILLG